MSDRRAGNLGYFTHDAARRFPDRVAMIDLCGDEPREVLYAELEERLDRFAAMITGLGLKPDDRLVMAVGNRFEFIEIMYGAIRAGIVPVPLNTKQGADVLAYIVENSDAVAAIVEPGCNKFIVDIIEAAGLAPRIAFGPAPEGWQDYETLLQAAPGEFEPPELDEDHPSFQPYTSGSTGRPKGVVLTHAGQLWGIRCGQQYWPEKSENRALAAVPMYHKNAMAGAFKPLLHVGGSVVILPDFEPRQFLQALSDYKCTNAGAVPAVFTLLLQHRDLIDSLDLSALQALSLGSAPVQPELMNDVEATFGVAVGESYGLTEGGPVPIGAPIDGRPTPVGSCGVAWPEGEVKLVGADGREDPHYGELWVRNPGVTPGYYKRPEVNAERIVEGWLKTGDMFACDDDGFYFFKGRDDDMFNCGGENIYPKEVEDLILRHPHVADASVVALDHAVKGHAPVARVAAPPAAGLDEATIKAFCLENGPAYAHPRRVEVVDALPLNGAGKVDRLMVKHMAEELFGKELGRESKK
jgi:acyl-CoA synthetase (AMP-forming)/AMP-acid ligase II